MFLYLVLLFTVLPAIELIVLIRIGQAFGIINALLLIIGTGVAGAYIARLQGFYVLQRIQNQLNQGIMPAEDVVNGAMILAGGITLLTPGLITDIIGFMLIIPSTRNIIKKILKSAFQKNLQLHDDIITVSGSFKEENNEKEDF